ncbi:MAG: DNA sulfur modification protein DndD [Flavobacteriales bacterium]
MFIQHITLQDYGIYQGANTLQFHRDAKKNVFILCGHNGAGKTTFLTSLVWCLYGKMMIDVDERYRKLVHDAGGYSKYALGYLNRAARIAGTKAYSVSLTFTGLSIPALPCKELMVTRTFDAVKGSDELVILIDGEPNQLTKDVGPEIFVNDFILPKEVAKFFFFDAEKIVELAEMRSLEDKRKLSKAYAEVLGIKKYEDLKENLVDMRIRLRAGLATDKEREKLAQLEASGSKLEGLIRNEEEQIATLQEEKAQKRQLSERLQEKLIREGSTMSVEALLDLKQYRDRLLEERQEIRAGLKELLDLAPFAIASKDFMAARAQVHHELEAKQAGLDPKQVAGKVKKVQAGLSETFKVLNLARDVRSKLLAAMEQQIYQQFAPPQANAGVEPLLAATEKDRNEFDAIHHNLTHSFSASFKKLVQADRENRNELNKVFRQVSDAQAKENDQLVVEIRKQKDEVDASILSIEARISQLDQEIGGRKRELTTIHRQTAELAKKVDLGGQEAVKDRTAEQLIKELDTFLTQLKAQKRVALETRIQEELARLMHKRGFIQRVEVLVQENIIDIALFDRKDQLVPKESLSKGEQQLYATAVLKALVDESNIKFPVFIDSPLQKLDKQHSKNIIQRFYPSVSEQVVLLPLLEKELTQEEYLQLKPKVGAAHRIEAKDEHHSCFKEVDADQLFELAVA